MKKLLIGLKNSINNQCQKKGKHTICIHEKLNNND